MGQARKVCGGLIALGVLMVAAPAFAAPMLIWAKDGGSNAVMTADLAACNREARDVSVSTQLAYGQGGAIGYLGGVLASEMLARRARDAHIRHCMHVRGYRGIPLTDDEEAQARTKRSAAAFSAWTAAFYASDDFAARLREAKRPVVPPLPKAVKEAYAFGAVRFDPSRLVAASGIVLEGSPVLSGSVGHRSTARLKAALKFEQVVNFSSPAGSIWHEVVAPGEEDSRQTYWCGPTTGHGFWAGLQVSCIWSNDDGYALAAATGENWLAGSVLLSPGGDAIPYPPPGGLDLTPAAEDLLGPLDFTLNLKKLGPSGMTLEARASRDGRSVVFWRRDLVFDGRQQAVLPFWRQRLVLTRTGSGVTVGFTADGDGSGWEDE